MRKLIIAMVFIIVLVLSGCVNKADPIEPPSKENPTESPSKADPIELPPINEIISVEITTGIEDIIHKDEAWIKSFIQKISEATPTSKKSVQDVPTVSKYTRVTGKYQASLFMKKIPNFISSKHTGEFIKPMKQFWSF